MKREERDRFELKTRAEWRDEIHDLCRGLNAAGYDPAWTPRTLVEYVNEKFRVLVGLDALSFDELRRLRDDLRRKLESARAEGKAAPELRTPAARGALEPHATPTDEAA